MSTALVTTATAAAAPRPIPAAPNAPRTQLNVFQTQIVSILATVGAKVAATAASSAPKFPILPLEMLCMVADYCGPLTPEQDVSQNYHPTFIENVGLARLARLRVVTGATLDVDKNLPWVIDESFPKVDVAKMPDGAVRGESSVEQTWDGLSKTSFIAIRYISNTSPTPPKVEFVFQGEDGSGWGQNLFGYSTRVTTKDYARLRDLLDGNPIQGAPECADTHRDPDERFMMQPNARPASPQPVLPQLGGTKWHSNKPFSGKGNHRGR